MRHPRDRYGVCKQCSRCSWQRFDCRVMMCVGEEGAEKPVPMTQRTGECGHTYYSEPGEVFPDSFLSGVGEVLEARSEYFAGLPEGMTEDEFDDLPAAEKKLVLAICGVEPIEDSP